jgi:hypothetical protein
MNCVLGDTEKNPTNIKSFNLLKDVCNKSNEKSKLDLLLKSPKI